MDVCPLIFEPLFKRRIWGGRRLESVLGKALPPDETIGESWELADLEDDATVVASGPAQGRTLRALLDDWGPRLLPDGQLFEGRFPLLLKYLDACADLSVQVHPTRAVAAQKGGPVRIKNEAWYVLDADEGACIYRGLQDGVTRHDFEQALRHGDCSSLLQRIPVRAGQCYYLPTGTVHSLGRGVCVAEVQTPSDTTFRLHDWNRVDPATGQPRDLHVEDGLACIHFGSQVIEGEARSHVASVWTTVTRLVTCESFIVERVKMVEGFDQAIPYARLVAWMVLQGEGVISFNKGRSEMRFKRGDTVVLPAGLEGARLRTEADCTWLEITLPDVASMA